jgi:hypothetical protein
MKYTAQRWFDRVVLARWWTCFLVLGISFFVFGGCTLNLFFLFRANAALVVEYGWQAIGDGAAQQFVELLANGYLGMLAYVVFKACEHSLVHRLTHPPAPHAPAPDEDRHPPR